VTGTQHGGERRLTAAERRTLALLALPTLGLALATTTVTTYLPVVASGFTGSTTVIGLIIGAEGLLALWLPLLAGIWSDRLLTPLGGRLPFVIGATPVVLVGLALMAAVGSLALLAAAALVFFAGYFLAYEPYRALYPDAVGEQIAGRAQGVQALGRGIGTALALVGGGLLIALATAAPFIAAAVAFGLCIALFARVLTARGIPEQAHSDASVAEAARGLAQLVRTRGPLRAFLVANALWELSLGALKAFVVLYVTTGLGYGRATAALIIGGVAVLVLGAAVASGRLADRFGTRRVLRLGLPIYGLGLLVPFLSAAPLLVALSTPFIAIGGGVIMALPYAVLMPLMPAESHGLMTGLYSFSRGIGTWLGPLLGGAAIALASTVFEATDGYQAVWGVCSLAVLTSLLFLPRRARPAEQA
jgi:MFS family permease